VREKCERYEDDSNRNSRIEVQYGDDAWIFIKRK